MKIFQGINYGFLFSNMYLTLQHYNINNNLTWENNRNQWKKYCYYSIWWYSGTENQKDQISCTLYLFIWSYVQYFFLCVYAYLYLFVCLLDIWEIILILKILFDHKQILDCHSSEIKNENIPQNYIKQASLHFLKYLKIYFLSIFPNQPVSFLRNFYLLSE